MKTYTKEVLNTILNSHKKWLLNLEGGERADLQNADLRYADLQNADLRDANLQNADLRYADLQNADLRDANLRYADLQNADLQNADLRYADLQNADLRDANLQDIKGLVKIVGVHQGNFYWKRFNENLENKGFKFKIGLNVLREGEEFESDERVLCSFPGFHFASRSWCALNYPTRPYEALIQIPLTAKINEPWATDGKASADSIIVLQVFDTNTCEDVTEKFK